jgi:hypothetical protein
MTETADVRNGSVQFFTIVAQNYLAHAFVLAESVQRHHPDAVFSVFLMDDVDRRWKSPIESRGIRAIYPEGIPLDRYRKFVFQYNVTEASTGVKPSVIQMLFDQGAEKVVYLDPDILCFGRLDEVLSALDRYNIVLTPHICSPAPGDYYPGEKGLMRSGVFNLGFIALRQSETGRKFVKWWSDHLEYDCVAEPDGGLFVDQKWVDLVPSCFDGVYILRSTAHNIAYWNLHERVLEERHGVFYETRSGEPVAFIHFSGIAIEDLDSICKYAARNPFGDSVYKKRYTLSARPDLTSPFQLYRRLLISQDVEAISKIPYAYANYDNGEPISDLERSLYRNSDAWRRSNADPFKTSRGSFWHSCRRADVRAVKGRDAKLSAEAIVEKYGRYMCGIQWLLRCCLFILGPEKYLGFAKYMRHQFLPSNHGFLLSGRREGVPPRALEAAVLTGKSHAKPVVEDPKSDLARALLAERGTTK